MPPSAPRRSTAVVLMIVLAVSAASGGAARADERAARAHFAAAEAAYKAEQYETALAEYRAGYAALARPAFLLNIAQTLRRLGRLDEAIASCERFLAVAPRSPLADEAERLRATLQSEAAEAKTRQATLTAPAPPAATAPAATAPAATAPARERPRRRGLWIALGIVGGLAVAGAAAGIAVAVTHPSDRFPSAPLGVVHF